jgi:hypothetical protein
VADSKKRRLEQLHAAANPLRFKLLQHACEVGAFSTGQIPRITGTPKTSGNARDHANHLVDFGLLHRSRRPAQYSVTDTGTLVYEALIGAMPAARRVSPQDVAMLALVQGTHVDELAAADDLVVALRARLRHARRKSQATYRLTRIDP